MSNNSAPAVGWSQSFQTETALLCLERQYSHVLYGGPDDSVFCADNAWRQTPMLTQTALWKAGLIQGLSLHAEREIVLRTGYGRAQQVASDDYVDELETSISHWERRLSSLRHRLGRDAIIGPMPSEDEQMLTARIMV